MTREESKKLAKELIKDQPSIVICGGGHVSLCLAELACSLDFGVTVLEDREDYGTKERFPRAQIILGSPAESVEKVQDEASPFFVIASRTHDMDKDYLRAVLEKNYSYIGMMASKNKRAYVMGELEKVGVDSKLLDQVHSPIGKDISAVTPSEIAVSILAEIIEIKNSKPRRPYAGTDVIRAIEEDQAAVVISIVDKGGSAPRGVGSMMILKKDGSPLGTIGGGRYENVCIERGQELLGTDSVEDLDFDVSAKGKLGMVCGGTMKVRLETIVD